MRTIGRRDFGGTPDKRGALAAGKWVLHIIAVVFVAGIVFGITVPIGIALTASLVLVGYILYAFAPVFVVGLIPVINAISFLVSADPCEIVELRYLVARIGLIVCRKLGEQGPQVMHEGHRNSEVT